MLNPSDDPGGLARGSAGAAAGVPYPMQRHIQHQQPLLATVAVDPQELSIASSNGSSVNEDMPAVVTQRKIIRHHNSNKGSGGGGGGGGGGMQSTKGPCGYVQPVAFIIVACCLTTIAIMVVICIAAILPVIRNARVVSDGLAEETPSLRQTLKNIQVLMNNNTKEILDNAVLAMDRFSNMVQVVEAGVSDPRFRDNIEGAYSQFVAHDLKQTMATARDLFAALTTLTGSIRTNGIQAQFVVPLVSPTTATTTTTQAPQALGGT
jgi:hypothetical protein